MYMYNKTIIALNISLTVCLSSLYAASESEQQRIAEQHSAAQMILGASSSSSESKQRKHPIIWGSSAHQGGRKTMEDFYSAQTPFEDSHKKAFFGMFDGHRGDMAARALAKGNSRIKPLHVAFAECIEGTAVERFQHAFRVTEESILSHCNNSGSTAVTAYIDTEKNTVTVAGIGDSRAVLVRNNSILATTDHNPKRPKELERITKAGGLISPADDAFPRYLSGYSGERLAMTRVFGNKDYKKGEYKLRGLVANPEIAHIKYEDTDNVFLILATDGLWDVVSNQDAADIVASTLNSYISSKTDVIYQPFEAGNNEAVVLAARKLRNKAYKLGSKDNISVLVAVINQWHDSAFAFNFTSEKPFETIDTIPIASKIEEAPSSPNYYEDILLNN